MVKLRNPLKKKKKKKRHGGIPDEISHVTGSSAASVSTEGGESAGGNWWEDAESASASAASRQQESKKDSPRRPEPDRAAAPPVAAARVDEEEGVGEVQWWKRSVTKKPAAAAPAVAFTTGSTTASTTTGEAGSTTSRGSRGNRSQQQQQEERPQRRRHSSLAAIRELGCCHGFLVTCVKAVHYTDMIFGVILIIYGILIYFEPPKNTLREASAITGWSGFILFFPSTAGNIGFWSRRCCRCGLTISRYAAPVIALCELVALFALMIGHDTFFNYLRTNQKKLLMNDSTINNLKAATPIFYLVFLGFAAIEISRFFLIGKLRDDLIEQDRSIATRSRQVRTREREERRRTHKPWWQGGGRRNNASSPNQHWAEEPLLGDSAA